MTTQIAKALTSLAALTFALGALSGCATSAQVEPLESKSAPVATMTPAEASDAPWNPSDPHVRDAVEAEFPPEMKGQLTTAHQAEIIFLAFMDLPADADLRELKSLPNLTSVAVHDSPDFTTAQLQQLGELKSLEGLTLSGTPVDDLTPVEHIGIINQ